MANSDLSFTLTGFSSQINGDYSLDLATLTNYDYHVIKDVSGVVAGSLGDAMSEGDQEVMIAFVAIVLIRAGVGNLAQLAKKPDGVLWKAQPGQIIWNVEVDEEGEKADPPNGSDDRGRNSSSSASSSDTSEPDPASDPSRTGQPPLDTGADSNPETLAV